MCSNDRQIIIKKRWNHRNKLKTTCIRSLHEYFIGNCVKNSLFDYFYSARPHVHMFARLFSSIESHKVVQLKL